MMPAQPIVLTDVPKRRRLGGWSSIAVGFVLVVGAGVVLFAVTRDKAEAGRKSSVAAAPTKPDVKPDKPAKLTSYRDFLSSAIETGCRRLQACAPTTRIGGDPVIAEHCSEARDLAAQVAPPCAFDATAAVACIESMKLLPCGPGTAPIDPRAWPTGIVKLPACASVCGVLER